MSACRIHPGLRAASRGIGVMAIAAATLSSSWDRTQGGKPGGVLESFDLRSSAAVQGKLARELQEISGLAVTEDGRVLAHADERGVVAQVDACRGTTDKLFSLGSPAVRGDFEGIAIAGPRIFLVTSTGHLFETREGANGVAMPFTALDTGFGRSCEIEGLAYEPADRTLLLGCKRSVDPALRGRVTFLRWSLDRGGPGSPSMMTIAPIDIARYTGSRSFHVTSVEREPRSGHYLLLAGPERLLVEVTPRGTAVAVRTLDRRLHPQPEGLTFLGDSVLVIADEGGAGRGSITCYRRAR